MALVALLAVVLVAPARAQTQIGSGWSWTDRSPKLESTACGGPGECVAVGAGGYTLASPTGAAAPLQWSGVPIGADEKLQSVACTGSQCVALSSGNGTAKAISQTFVSTNGGLTWSGGPGAPLPAVDDAGGSPTQAGAAVACDPDGTCYIAGPTGGVWRSTDGGTDWEGLKQPSGLGLGFTALACPDSGVCVLVGTAEGSAVLRGTTAKKVDITLEKGTQALAIACDSPSRCIAADDSAHVITTSAPFTDWSNPEVLPGKKTDATTLGSLSCPQPNSCVGIADFPHGRALVGAPGGWRRINVGSAALDTVGCAKGTGVCVATGNGASWWLSSNGGVNWRPINDVPALTQLDCPAAAPAGTCVGAGTDAIGKTTSNGDLWTTPFPGLTTLDAAGVSCRGWPDCLVIGKSKVLATPDGGDTWNFRFAAGDVTAGPGGAACVDIETCYGAGNGASFSTFDAARTPWQTGPIPTAPAETLTGMACPKPDLCLVSGSDSIYRGTVEVVGGRAHWNWVPTDAAADDAFKAISCASPTYCAAVGSGVSLGDGQVASTTDPALLHWESHTIKNTIEPSDATALDAIDCPVAGLCVAGALRGFVTTTTDDWATYSLEQLPSPVADSEKNPDIAGVKCTAPNRCLLLGAKPDPPKPNTGAVYLGATR